MRILLGLLLAPVLATMPVSPALAQKKPEAARRQDDMGTIIELLRSGKIQDALDLIDPMLARFEKTYADEKRLIFCAESTEEALLVSSAAQDTGKDVLVIDSDWCYALWAKGYALVDIHRVAEAVPYLERSVAMMPFNAQFMCELGNAYGELKQWDKAFATFERAREVAERLRGDARTAILGRALRGGGFSLIELGRWDEAEDWFNAALELDPDDEKAKSELDYIARNRPKRR